LNDTIIINAFVVAVDAPDVDVVVTVAGHVIADAHRASERVAKGRAIVGVVDARSGVKTLDDDDARANSLQKPFTRGFVHQIVWVFSMEWIWMDSTKRTVQRAGDDGCIRLLSYKNAIYFFIRHVCARGLPRADRIRRRRRMRVDALEGVSAWRERRRLETTILSWMMGPGGRATVFVVVWMPTPMVSTEASLR
jgi:hypothetical protein